ncbi:DotU/TssL family secretion system protein [Pseudomonas sp. LJDD11]|uniref:DotU family type IV/VI secretion system protein n=1 Tax=unclassified Pseudomonas TaxID=196821 RepID=UPI0004F8F2AA|nr:MULTISPECIES: DotU/TssL family secretion system protein [unclassified Pseudomonas]MCQ9422892.1 DotU/TssL family secretion system protein [Pseudomonas sp. LJDD11]BAP45292.1 type VI secretion system protein ImpK [Pseudomonas sp. StFLB209]
MFDNDPSQSGANFESTPLSSALGRAWLEWLSFWQTRADTLAAQDQTAQVAEQVSLIARRLWRSAYAAVGEAQGDQAKATLFAFVAVVDEFLLFTSWAGQAAWVEQPMESRLFKTRMAGDRLPLEIKRVLDSRDPALRDLANVYLLCLTLGFQGRLRNGNGKALHEKWRRALFTFSRQRPPSLDQVQLQMERLGARPAQQMPQRSSMPDGYRLVLALTLGLVLLIGLGQGLWWDVRQHLEASLGQPSTEQSE